MRRELPDMLIRSLGLGTMFCPGRDAERLDVEDVEDRSGGCLSHGQVIPGVGAPFPPCGERGRAESAAE